MECQWRSSGRGEYLLEHGENEIFGGGWVVREENADKECGKMERMHLSPAKKGRKKSA